MFRKLLSCGLVSILLASVGAAGISAQEERAQAHQGAAAIVPALVRYTGVAAGHSSERMSMQFSIYAAADGGSALWSERQSVTIAADGKYAVMLGAGSSLGLPQSVFAAGEGRWLAVRVGDADEPQRVLLTSVPYAMKAADAESLAGRAAQDFVTHEELAANLAAQVATATSAASAELANATGTTGSGTAKYLPIWTSASALGNSVISQSGTTASSFVGIGTSAPATRLDVNGATTLRGAALLSTTISATASLAANSPLLELSGSAFNKSVNLPVAQKFAWQAVAAGNNTAAPTSSLKLLFGSGVAAPAPTGLAISPRGVITFASAQTFPGNTIAAGPGIVSKVSGKTQTLSIDTARIPLLGSGNSFLGTQKFAALTASGTASANTVNSQQGYEMNGSLFAFGTTADGGSAFLGFAGNPPFSGLGNVGVGMGALGAIKTGSGNTAVGADALKITASGTGNTALGGSALFEDTIGSSNTAVGAGALTFVETGSMNTAVGLGAGPDDASTSISNSTAIGANAAVSQSNSLVLGQTKAGNPGVNYVNVGIGTATPVSPLEISVSAAGALGPTLTLTNPAGAGASASIDFKTYLHASTATSPTARIFAADDNNYGTNLFFYSKYPGHDANTLEETMEIDSKGDVDIVGTLSASLKEFKIDHPTDPANKYLVHASVESSEMMNIYSGNVTTDELGLATVTLPDWFEAENTDFRYQLTTIGRDAHAWVAEEVGNKQFKIATNATHVKVSWQITAVRQDAFAKAHPMVVEDRKPETERGYYIHPELYGQTSEKQIGFAHHPKKPAR